MKTTDATSFTPAQVAQLSDRLKEWAAAHKNPSMVVMAFTDGREFTPAKIASAVASRNEDGTRILRMLEQGLEYGPFETILAGYPV